MDAVGASSTASFKGDWEAYDGSLIAFCVS